MSTPTWEEAVPITFTQTDDPSMGDRRITVDDFPAVTKFDYFFLERATYARGRAEPYVTCKDDIVSIHVNNGWCRYRIVEHCLSRQVVLCERLGPAG